MPYQRRFSASATTLRASEDALLLKPPPRFVRRAPASYPPLPTPNPTMAAMMAGAAPAAPGFHDGHAQGRPSQPVFYYQRGPQQQSAEDFVARTDRANARAAVPHPQQPRTSYHVLQAPAADPSASAERLPDAAAPRPAMYNRQRRPSNASNASASTATASLASRESFESRMRSSSWSSQTSFESFYSAQSQSSPYPAPARGYHPYGFQRPAPLKQLRRRAQPGELFAALPGEVLELILDELRTAHLAPGSPSCATCWMRDACAMALSARKMLKYARAALYGDIQLVGADSAHQRKKYKPLATTRLALLRKTLRTSPLLAAMVRSLKVPALPPGLERDAYHDAVASLVMVCPNLERLVGFHPGYDHSFSRLFHSLSTRRRLKETSWIVEPSRFQRQHRIHAVVGSQRHHITPGDLQPEQSASFADLHSNWQYLATLTVHCRPGATLSPGTLLVESVLYLPALQSLHLSSLPHTAFDDAALLSLPALKKLTLSHMTGITSAGLSAFATRGASCRSLESLTLAHVNIDSLPALARAFSNLRRLASFALVQSYPPVLPLDDPIVLFPYLASSSLRRLHWDVPTHPTAANAADHVLARSMAAGGFPALLRLRAPADPEGLFQSLCRPQEKADLPGDRYRGGVARHYGHLSRPSTSSSGPQSPTQRAFALQNGPGPGTDEGGPRQHSDLHLARLAAQARLEAARAQPRFFVNVIDEDGVLVEKYGLAGFMGSVGSRTAYYLLPDPGAADEKGGLADVEDLLGDGGEDLLPTGAAGKEGKERKTGSKGDAEPVRAREGCTGRWNASGLDKKDKERWFHTERGRWHGVTLS